MNSWLWLTWSYADTKGKTSQKQPDIPIPASTGEPVRWLRVHVMSDVNASLDPSSLQRPALAAAVSQNNLDTFLELQRANSK